MSRKIRDIHIQAGCSLEIRGWNYSHHEPGIHEVRRQGLYNTSRRVQTNHGAGVKTVARYGQNESGRSGTDTRRRDAGDCLR